MIAYSTVAHNLLTLVDAHGIVWCPGMWGQFQGWHRIDNHPLSPAERDLLNQFNESENALTFVHPPKTNQPYGTRRPVRLTLRGLAVLHGWDDQARQAVAA